MILGELLEVLARDGYVLEGSVQMLPGKTQRFNTQGRRKTTKDFFVIIHDDMQGATYGDWHDDRSQWVTWRSSSAIQRERDPEKARLQNELIAKAKEKRGRLAFHAKRRAIGFYYSFNAQQHHHPYIVKKRIKPYYATIVKKYRWIHDIVLLPIRDVHYKMQSVQIIFANGFKRCWKNTSYKNNMIWLHPQLPSDYCGQILIAEGYATGATIQEATLTPTVCALSASNLVNIVPLLRNKFPHAQLIICADNDQFTKGNPGIKAAMRVATISNTYVIAPDFTGVSLDTKPTDFNDLQLLCGQSVVESQIMGFLNGLNMGMDDTL